MLSGYLLAIVLAGLIAAVSELLLPSRIFSVGRLLRALICLTVVVFIVAWFCSFFGAGEDVFSLPEGQENPPFIGGDTKGPEEHVEQLAFAQLREQIAARAKEVLGGAVEVEVFWQEDINGISACIYCDNEPSGVAALTAQLKDSFGVTCQVKKRE